jgi:hypothetical protein
VESNEAAQGGHGVGRSARRLKGGFSSQLSAFSSAIAAASFGLVARQFKLMVFDFRFPDAALCFFIPSLFAVRED